MSMPADAAAPLAADIRDGVILGAAIVVGNRRENLLAWSSGAAVPDGSVAMTPDTIIDIASVTKVLATTTALLVGRDRGWVDFDAPFTEYVPFAAELFRPPTLRELAAHVSGFGHIPGVPRQYWEEDADGPRLMDNILRFPPLCPPGERCEYACWNMLLLGLVFERASGRRLDDFCREEIFLPLGMFDTSLGRPVTDDPARLAQTFGTRTPGEISDFIAYRVYRDGGTAGNAGAFSTANDLARFARCVLRGGVKDDGTRLFSQESLCEITTSRVTPEAAAAGEDSSLRRSFGWILRDKRFPPAASEDSLYHSGWSGQTLFVDRGRDCFVVVLTPRSGRAEDYDRAFDTRFHVVDALLRRYGQEAK